jgi:carboxyl-terminal processing protease
MIRQIEQNYILEVDRGELMETALRAIVGKLDARGGFLRTNDLQFLSTRELADANASIEQKFAGIGAVLKVAGEEVVVRSALPGSPALEGGLQAGDRIVTVNGDPLPETKALETAVRLLRGPPGTPVNLGVKRAGSEDVRDLQFVRGTIRLPSVAGARRRPEQTWDFMLDEARKIGYVRLSQIGQRSAEEVRDVLSDLTARGMKAFILDLRNDPGGLLAGAVAVSDLFVERGPIVTVRGRSGETAHDATAEGTFSGFPMAVLVNRKTASAAEIVAACLQDHRRAVVVGERTFGQGIVRSLFRLSSGAGALNLPVASYFRPSGKSMNRYPNSADSDDWGVRPDDGYEVALSDEELKQYEKTREEREEAGASKEAETAFEDRQLQKALAWILAPLGRQ